jgi:hypothetical protein
LKTRFEKKNCLAQFSHVQGSLCKSKYLYKVTLSKFGQEKGFTVNVCKKGQVTQRPVFSYQGEKKNT